MSRTIASRARFLRQSAIRAMTARALEKGGVNLSQGLCELPTPESIKEAACRAVMGNRNMYAPLNGLAALRGQIAARLECHNGISADPETQIAVTSGATGGYVCAMLSLLEAGDKVALFEPFYGYHLNSLGLFGFRPVCLRLEPPDWEVDFKRLERLLADGVRVLVLNTPANPSGKVFNRQELETLGDLCRKYDIWVVTDEIYEQVVFGEHRHVSLASLPCMFERTVTVSGFSKTFAMTGWRLGYACGPAEVIEKMSLVSDLVYICAPHPLQAGVAEAMAGMDDSYYRGLAALYTAKRAILAEALTGFGFEVFPAQGTYFLLADYSGRYGRVGSFDAAERLLEERAIATVPSASFYSGGEDRTWLRFCFAKEDAELRRAAELLAE
jgi:aminotransferase